MLFCETFIIRAPGTGEGKPGNLASYAPNSNRRLVILRQSIVAACHLRGPATLVLGVGRTRLRGSPRRSAIVNLAMGIPPPMAAFLNRFISPSLM
jgi:hypothetical protein